VISTLRLSYGATSQEFAPGTTVMVGRDPNCTVVVDDGRVSRRHLSFYVEGGRWVVTHLSKSNPTFLNGAVLNTEAIEGPCVVYLSQLSNGPRLDVDLVAPAAPLSDLIAKQPLPLREIVAQRARNTELQSQPKSSNRIRFRKRR
jgi:ABC transport system ATP-binding/permease protein